MVRKKNKLLPNSHALVEFIQSHPDQGAVRHVARAFGLRGEDRIWLKAKLKRLSQEGLINRRGKRLHAPDSLPPVAVLSVFRQNEDGDLLASYGDQVQEEQEILVAPGRFALKVGDRILAHIEQIDRNRFSAHVIKILAKPLPQTLLVIYRDGLLYPTDRKIKKKFFIDATDPPSLRDGDLLLVAPLSSGSKSGAGSKVGKFDAQPVKIVKNMGPCDTISGASLVALQTHDIPQTFPEAVLDEAGRAQPATMEGREDLRHIPLVTVDGITARDFDDAVYAEPLSGEDDKTDGWRILVAIADVAAYVLPGSALDQEARLRGNSIYLPDRSIPMLPEALSNHWCSLKPHENRACIAVWLTINREGKLKESRFVRGLMRSRARLTYEQLDAFREKLLADKKSCDNKLQGLSGSCDRMTVENLYGAFEALARARLKRGTLELDIPEYEIKLDQSETGIQVIDKRERLDSHRLIEEFMILANVAAAKTLGKREQALMFRVHEAPRAAKLDALNTILKAMELPQLRASASPKDFARLLQLAEEKEAGGLLSALILKSQSQAVYAPENAGHFGLALEAYAHFTSPIRRYADLIVHRALIRALGLSLLPDGSDALRDEEIRTLDQVGEHISHTERRASLVERDARDRLLGWYMSSRVGENFKAVVVSVTAYGLFVQLVANGAQGLLALSSLADDYYYFDDKSGQLHGEHHGQVFSLGDQLEVELLRVDLNGACLGFRFIRRLDTAQKAFLERKSGSRRKTGFIARKQKRVEGGKAGSTSISAVRSGRSGRKYKKYKQGAGCR